MTKTGLVLEGGAMRGIFTAGILDEFLARDIRFDGIVGVSAGAVFGCSFKSHQMGRSLRYNLRYCRDWRHCSFRSLLLTGDLYGADFCYRRLPMELDPFDSAAFAADPAPFWVVTTDVQTGQPLYHLCSDCGEEDLRWMRASASMPLVSRIVEADGHRMLDGGISDSIPLRFMKEQGFEKNLVILTQPRDFIKEPSSHMGLIRRALRRYPKVIDAMERRHAEYNETLDYIREQEQAGSVLVLAPKEKLPLHRTEKDPDRIRAVHELGQACARENEAAVRAFLGL